MVHVVIEWPPTALESGKAGGANIIIATLPSKLSSWNCWNQTHFKDIIPKERKWLRNCPVFVESYFPFEVITICFSMTNSVRTSILCVPYRSATIVKTGKTMFLPRFGGYRSKTFTLNPVWHDVGKQEKCSSLEPPSKGQLL